MKPIFVSSTFRDMQVERDILALQVMPKLNRYAKEFGEYIKFVDLRWGVNTSDLDDEESNRKVLSVCLDEIDKTRPYMIILVGERYGWVPDSDLLIRAAENKNYSISEAKQSVTALEIEYGALSEKGVLEQCIFYFREPLNKEDIPPEHLATYIEQDPEINAKLSSLKMKILASGAKIRHYKCEYNKESAKLDIPSSFADTVYDDVSALFRKDFEAIKNMPWQERDEIIAATFAEQKASLFSAGKKLLCEMEEIVAVHRNYGWIYGDSGSGKSTLISKFWADRRSEGANTLILACGLTEFASTAIEIVAQTVYKLENLLGISEHFGSQLKDKLEDKSDKNDETRENENAISLTEWVSHLESLLFQYGERNLPHFYIFYDEVYKLPNSADLNELTFLPTSLPHNVSITLTLTTSSNAPSYIPYRDDLYIFEIAPLQKEEILPLIDKKIEDNMKELSDVVKDAIINLPGSNSPLYLSLVIERLFMLDSDDFERISAGGNDMVAINNFMLEIIDSLPEETTELAVSIIKEAASRVNPEFLNDITALISLTIDGLRLSDLTGIYAEDGREFSNIDFTIFTNYLHTLLPMQRDGRYMFAYKAISSGFSFDAAENHDITELYLRLFAHLSGLPFDDHLRRLNFIICYYFARNDEVDLYMAGELDNIIDECDDEAIEDYGRQFVAIIRSSEEFALEFYQSFLIKSYSLSVLRLTTYCILKTLSNNSSLLRELLPTFKLAIEPAIAFLNDPSNFTDEKNDYFYSYLRAVNFFRKLAVSASKIGEYQYAEEVFKRGEELLEKFIDEFSSEEKELTASLYYSALKNHYQTVGESEKAALYLEKCLVFEKKQFNAEKSETTMINLAIAYNDKANEYRSSGEFKEAKKYRLMAKDILFELTELYPSDENEKYLNFIYSNLTNDLYDELSYQEAINYLLKSAEISEKILNKTRNTENYLNLAQDYRNLALGYYYLNSNEQSIFYSEKSFEIYKILYNSSSTNENLDKYIKSITELSSYYINNYKVDEIYDIITEKDIDDKTLIDLGRELVSQTGNIENKLIFSELLKYFCIVLKAKESDDATAYFEEYIDVCKDATTHKTNKSESTKKLIAAYTEAVDYFGRLDDRENVQKYFDECLLVIDKIDKSQIDAKKTDYIIKLYKTYANHHNDFQTKLDYWKKAKNLANQLIDAGSNLAKSDLALIESYIGNAYYHNGQHQEALIHANSATDHFKEIYLASENFDSLLNLCHSYPLLGYIYIALDNIDMAAECYREANHYGEIYVAYENHTNQTEFQKFSDRFLPIAEFFYRNEQYIDAAKSYLAIATAIIRLLSLSSSLYTEISFIDCILKIDDCFKAAGDSESGATFAEDFSSLLIDSYNENYYSKTLVTLCHLDTIRAINLCKPEDGEYDSHILDKAIANLKLIPDSVKEANFPTIGTVNTFEQILNEIRPLDKPELLIDILMVSSEIFENKEFEGYSEINTLYTARQKVELLILEDKLDEAFGYYEKLYTIDPLKEKDSAKLSNFSIFTTDISLIFNEYSHYSFALPPAIQNYLIHKQMLSISMSATDAENLESSITYLISILISLNKREDIEIFKEDLVDFYLSLHSLYQSDFTANLIAEGASKQFDVSDATFELSNTEKVLKKTIDPLEAQKDKTNSLESLENLRAVYTALSNFYYSIEDYENMRITTFNLLEITNIAFTNYPSETTTLSYALTQQTASQFYSNEGDIDNATSLLTSSCLMLRGIYKNDKTLENLFYFQSALYDLGMLAYSTSDNQGLALCFEEYYNLGNDMVSLFDNNEGYYHCGLAHYLTANSYYEKAEYQEAADRYLSGRPFFEKSLEISPDNQTYISDYINLLCFLAISLENHDCETTSSEIIRIYTDALAIKNRLSEVSDQTAELCQYATSRIADLSS